MPRTLVAALLPAVGITVAWLGLEGSPQTRDGIVVAALALIPALVPAGASRILACVAAVFGAGWIAFDAQPWELLPFRDERVLAPALRDAANGVVDFYAVFLPFEPTPNPEMHSLVLCAIFGFVLATALLVAARRPLAAAAVTIAGIGWPATLLGGRAVAIGALALAAALAIPLILRASSARTVVVGGRARSTRRRRRGRNLVRDDARCGRGARLGDVEHPRIERARDERPLHLGVQLRRCPLPCEANCRVHGRRSVAARVLARVDPRPVHGRPLVRAPVLAGKGRCAESALGSCREPPRESQRRNWSELTPLAASRRAGWVQQEVEIEAYDDDHVVAAGTPVAIDASRLGTVFQLSGGVLRTSSACETGTGTGCGATSPARRPRSWRHRAPVYPAAAERFLELDGRELPAFGAADRDRLVDEFFADPSYRRFQRYRGMYELADRVRDGARTPYETVLALESWFRQTGGFTYDESPPRVKGPPLAVFVTRTRPGYCQHFAGAMATMLRMLGVPARVAVGFTSGIPRDGRWEVADRDAHAWVEVWFRGYGWIPFDPTPGRGTLGGEYSFASSSEEAVAALRRGELRRTVPERAPRVPDAGDLPGETGTTGAGSAPSLVGVGLLLAAAWVLLLGLGKAVVRRARYVSRDPRRVATASRRELEDFLRDQGAEVPRNATLATLQKAVQQELGLDARRYAAAAALARFGRPGSEEAGAETARHEVRRLLSAARRDLSVWARFRGLVSLRSLRTAASP